MDSINIYYDLLLSVLFKRRIAIFCNTICFCVADSIGHADISAMVRPQPRHSGVVASIAVDVCIMQTWVQGEAGSGVGSGCWAVGGWIMEVGGSAFR